MNPNSGQRMNRPLFRPTLMPMGSMQQVVMSTGGGVFTSSAMSQPTTLPATSLQSLPSATQSVVMQPMRPQRSIPKANLYLCKTSQNASGEFWHHTSFTGVWLRLSMATVSPQIHRLKENWRIATRSPSTISRALSKTWTPNRSKTHSVLSYLTYPESLIECQTQCWDSYWNRGLLGGKNFPLFLGRLCLDFDCCLDRWVLNTPYHMTAIQHTVGR